MAWFSNLRFSITNKILLVLAILTLSIFAISIVLICKQKKIDEQISQINEINDQQISKQSFNDNNQKIEYNNQKLEQSNDNLFEKINQLQKDLSQLENKLNNHICEIKQPNVKMTFGDMVQRIADLEVNNNSLEPQQLKQNLINSLSTALTKHNQQHDANNKKTNSEIEQINSTLIEIQNDQSQAKTKNSSQDKSLTELYNSKISLDKNQHRNKLNENQLRRSKNDLSQFKSKNFTELQNNQINQGNNISDLQSSTKELSTRITSVVQNLPKTALYYYQTKDWQFPFSSSGQQTVTHPASSKLTFTKKSFVTFTINMHLLSNVKCYVNVLKDKQSITQAYLQNYAFYYSYYYVPNSNSEHESVNFVQETIVDVGTYLFEIGLFCPGAINSYANGLGYTIKVQDLS